MLRLYCSLFILLTASAWYYYYHMEAIKKRPKIYAALAVTLVSLITHFAFFGQPKEAVFDEVYFGKFVSGYYEHTYYFDIHPPLGKLLIAGFGKVAGYKPTSNFDSIGTKYTDNGYMILRFLPTLAGSLLPLVIFLLALELGMSVRGSTIAGLLIAFENALVTQSRFILLDSFLLLFGFSALLLYLKYRQNKNVLFFVASGLLGGAAASIKWTGITFLAIPLVFELVTNWGRHKWRPQWKTIQRCILYMIAPLILYVSVFMVHFSLLYKSGTGDNYMSSSFQRTLEGNTYQSIVDMKTSSMFDKFVELNQVMYTSNQGIGGDSHSYGSKWYTWPLMLRSVYYWQGSDGTVSNIYLLGNPVIWYSATIALIVGLIGLFTKRIKATGALEILYFGYIINLLPFIQIKRVMFLYHYLVALVFSILILAYLIDRLEKKDSRLYGRLLVGLAIIAFLFFAPLTYGLPVSQDFFNAHFWLQSWK